MKWSFYKYDSVNPNRGSPNNKPLLGRLYWSHKQTWPGVDVLIRSAEVLDPSWWCQSSHGIIRSGILSQSWRTLALRVSHKGGMHHGFDMTKYISLKQSLSDTTLYTYIYIRSYDLCFQRIAAMLPYVLIKLKSVRLCQFVTIGIPLRSGTCHRWRRQLWRLGQGGRR